MLTLHDVTAGPEAYLALAGHEIRPDQLARQKPDRLFLVEQGGQVAARCGLWYEQTPPLPGHKLGLVGHYFATSDESGRFLLDHACSLLAERGCTLAVGPMDGNTWQRYRLVTERGSEPPFFLEPDNPDDWPDHFTGSGFTPLASYTSALTDGLERRDPRSPATAERLAEQGIVLRTLRLDDFEGELLRIHALSLLSFAGNFLYTPISAEDFLAQYLPIRGFVRPDLVLLAEQAGELVGYLFGVPDLLQQKRGRPIDTALVKTMAVRPDRMGLGLGAYLMDRAHLAMHQAGFRRAIHALMHQDNASGKISRHTARVIRRYTLFARPLAGGGTDLS